MSYQIFCMGNPLLDVQVRDGGALLKKYDLQANNAIRAEDKHEPMCVNAIIPYDSHSQSRTTYIVAMKRSRKTTPPCTSQEEGPRTLRVEPL